MTEEEWFASVNPTEMLELSAITARDRKLRLFAVNCCRQNEEAFENECDLDAIRVAEQFADRLVEERVRAEAEQRLIVSHDLLDLDEECTLTVPYYVLAKDFSIRDAGLCARIMAYGANYSEGGFDGLEAELSFDQAVMLRDIFGNPFRPVAFDSRWRTSDVVGLAQAIYDDKGFERMPILADALMDAGCEVERVISHCRGEGPHVRGCWVVDLILGKE